MPKPHYSDDLKARVIAYFDDDHTAKETEEKFGVPRYTIYTWTKAAGRTKPVSDRRAAVAKEAHAALADLAEAPPTPPAPKRGRGRPPKVAAGVGDFSDSVADLKAALKEAEEEVARATRVAEAYRIILESKGAL